MLINCPECKKEVSDKAMSCPHCGYLLKEIQQPLSTPQVTPPSKKKTPLLKKEINSSLCLGISAYFALFILLPYASEDVSVSAIALAAAVMFLRGLSIWKKKRWLELLVFLPFLLLFYYSLSTVYQQSKLPKEVLAKQRADKQKQRVEEKTKEFMQEIDAKIEKDRTEKEKLRSQYKKTCLEWSMMSWHEKVDFLNGVDKNKVALLKGRPEAYVESLDRACRRMERSKEDNSFYDADIVALLDIL